MDGEAIERIASVVPAMMEGWWAMAAHQELLSKLKWWRMMEGRSRIKKVCDKGVSALLFWANRCNRRDRVQKGGREVEVPGTSSHRLTPRYQKYQLLILHTGFCPFTIELFDIV